MKRLSLIIIALLAYNWLHGQTIIHPLKVIDAGGGKSVGDGWTLATSVSQHKRWQARASVLKAATSPTYVHCQVQ